MIIISIFFLFVMIFSPMRMPVVFIRIHVLWNTPIGTSMDNVIDVINSKDGWGNPIINTSFGFEHPTRFFDTTDGLRERVIIGTQSIQTRIIIYNFNILPFHQRNIHILWGFNEEGELIDIYVSANYSPRLR